MIKYAIIPSNIDFECVVCRQKADYVLKFNRNDLGDVHTYFCKKCFEKFKHDFKNNNLVKLDVSAHL